MNKFIVSGVPRSGTTALANLLNWHPTVFCGIERFPLAKVDQSFFTRESIIDESIPSAHFGRNRDILEEKMRLDAIGDKGPRYFYRLADSEMEFSDMKLIFIIRNITGVYHSWNKRAFNQNDTSWHRGQTGVFAYLDYLQLLFTLNRIRTSHESVVISYEDLFFGNPSKQHHIIDQIFDFIGAPQSTRVLENFDGESVKRQSLTKKKADLSVEESEFLNLVQLAPLFTTLSALGGITTAKKLDTLAESLLNDFYERRREILSAVDQLLLPDTGISQAMTVMRLCYQLSGGNNIYSSIKTKKSTDNSNFELLTMLFNASHRGDNQEAFSAGQNLLYRFPECTEILVEMSVISDRLKDKKNSIAYTKKAMELRPGNAALFHRLKHLIGKY
jgi:hypothetical protein